MLRDRQIPPLPGLLLSIALTLAATTGSAGTAPQLGEPVSAAELSRLSITVLPDGRGLPQGSGNAVDGAQVYQRLCLACHGKNGQGGINNALSGGHGTLAGDKPVRTVGSFWPYATSLFDYVRRAMPYNAPGSLGNNELYAVTAYVLYANKIIPQNAAMNATTLPAVVMPNRDGFDWPAIAPEKKDHQP